MKRTIKILTASMMALMILGQAVPVLGATYSSGVIVGSPKGFREPLEIVASKGTYVLLGQTLQLDVNEDYIAVWSSSDQTIATIDGNGLLTAVAPGTVVITAESGRQKDTTEVTILDPAPLMEDTAAEMAAGNEAQQPAEPEQQGTEPVAEPVQQAEPEPQQEAEQPEEPASTPAAAPSVQEETVPQPAQKRIAVIVINGENTRVTYDGTEHTLDRFTATSNDETFDPEKVRFDGTLGVTGKDCGIYELNLEGVVFTYDDPDVVPTFVVNNSFMRITPAGVTVAANAAEKEAGQDDPELTATVTGVLGEDEIVYILSREQGEEPGTYQILPSGEEIQGNYRIRYESALLTISEPVQKEEVTENGETQAEDEAPEDAEKAAYRLSFSVMNAGQNAVLPEPKEYAEGEQVRMPAAEDLDGYMFSGWYANGKRIDGETFTMPAEDTEISGTYYGPISVNILSDWVDGETGYAGTKITLTADIRGPEGLIYTCQWQYLADGRWTDMENETGTTMTYELNDETSGRTWRVEITDVRPAAEE